MSLRIEDLKFDHGQFLVKLSRKTIKKHLQSGKTIDPPEDTPSLLQKKAGVFTTLNTHKQGKEELRGCIGIIEARKPLVKATIDSAISAATQDPRFPPISEDELTNIIIELTVLTPPKKVEFTDPNELRDKIEIGRDGLIIKQGSFQGTLLPQVPVQQNWKVNEFLQHLCRKAGLPRDCWKSGAEILAYQGKIWKEKKPGGPVVIKE